MHILKLKIDRKISLFRKKRINNLLKRLKKIKKILIHDFLTFFKIII